MKDKIYLIWEDGEDEQYYSIHFSLEDAVSSYDDPVEVFEASPKLLGTFEKSFKVSKVKGKKK